MNVVILNGSPKRESSLTMHYVRFLQQKFGHHEYRTFHISKEIKKLERSRERFDEVIEEVRRADLVLWDFPVYFFLTPSQMVRFFELIIERGAEDAFAGRYTAAISTSKHFYDHTAHDYVRALSEDLGMKYIGFHSAEMEDLTDGEKRAGLVNFGERVFGHVEHQRPVSRRFLPVTNQMPEFTPPACGETPKVVGPKIVIVTDATSEDTNLNRMVEHFIKKLPVAAEVINLNTVEIKGGCLGCLHCCNTGSCVYRDDHAENSQRLLSADAVVYAMKVGHRYFSAVFKANLDRHFVNGHRPVTEGQHVAHIVSGPLRQLSTLEQILTAMIEVGRTSNAGVVTDEDADSELVADLLEQLGRQLLEDIERDDQRPWTFLGKGGHLIFRDLVYERNGVMREDFNYYKEHGLFDYPQNDYKNRLEQVFTLVATRLSTLGKKKIDPKMKMLEPYQRVLETQPS